MKEEEKRRVESDFLEMKREKIRRDVVDLTVGGVDEKVKKYLSLVPDFCETQTRILYEKLISVTEKMASDIRRQGGSLNIEDIEKEVCELKVGVMGMLNRIKDRQVMMQK